MEISAKANYTTENLLLVCTWVHNTHNRPDTGRIHVKPEGGQHRHTTRYSTKQLLDTLRIVEHMHG